MGVGYNPKIVTDGLILCLDAANRRSFPTTGSPLGTTWYDLSGNSSDCDLRDGPTYATNEIAFGGLNDRGHITNNSPFRWSPDGSAGSSTMTINIWANTNADTDGGYFYSKPWNGSGQYNIRILVNNFILAAGEAGSPVGFVSKTISFGRSVSTEWTNITCWMDGTNMGYYMNYDEFSNTGTAHAITGGIPSKGDNSVNLCLMSLYPYNSNPWAGNTAFSIEGSLGIVQVYDRVLTSDEVQQNFNAHRGRYGI